MPARCVVNRLFTEPVPDELKSLDALSKQLIQQAKAFQALCGWVHILVKCQFIIPSKPDRYHVFSAFTTIQNIGNLI